jgi:hypothetical protein
MTLCVLLTPPPTDCGFPTVRHPNQLTPWSRVLPENITGPQLVKKFQTFCGTRRFITAFKSARHPLLVLNQKISPSPRPREVFRNISSFYGEELLAPRPTPKLEDTPCRLSATAYSIHQQLLPILEAVPPSATWGWAMLWWQGRMYHGGTLRTRISVALCTSDIWPGFAGHLETECTAKRHYCIALS